MMLIVHIPSEGNGGKPRRALAGMQHYKKLAFPTPSGKYVTTPITMVAITTPHNNQERIEAALALHRPYGDGTCSVDDEHYPCRTVRLLTGQTLWR